MAARPVDWQRTNGSTSYTQLPSAPRLMHYLLLGAGLRDRAWQILIISLLGTALTAALLWRLFAQPALFVVALAVVLDYGGFLCWTLNAARHLDVRALLRADPGGAAESAHLVRGAGVLPDPARLPDRDVCRNDGHRVRAARASLAGLAAGSLRRRGCGSAARDLRGRGAGVLRLERPPVRDRGRSGVAHVGRRGQGRAGVPCPGAATGRCCSCTRWRAIPTACRSSCWSWAG